MASLKLEWMDPIKNDQSWTRMIGPRSFSTTSLLKRPPAPEVPLCWPEFTDCVIHIKSFTPSSTTCNCIPPRGMAVSMTGEEAASKVDFVNGSLVIDDNESYSATTVVNIAHKGLGEQQSSKRRGIPSFGGGHLGFT